MQPTESEIELVILDCDGVLFDSRPANVAFHNAVMKELGQAPLDTAGEDLGHYMAAGQLYDHLFGTSTELRLEAKRVARAMDYGPFYEFMKPVPALIETLETLVLSHKLAMASNRSRTAHGVAERFDLQRYFSLVVGTREVERPKPAPDMLELCMQKVGVSKQATVFVGDAITDRDAADAAGIDFIGVGPAASVADPISELRELPARLAADR